jgi:hypothetical protein
VTSSEPSQSTVPAAATKLTPEDTPVKDKEALITELQIAIEDTRALLAELGVETAAIIASEGSSASVWPMMP